MNAFPRALVAGWCELNRREQKAVALVLALFLLGLAVRMWHAPTAVAPADAERPAAARGHG